MQIDDEDDDDSGGSDPIQSDAENMFEQYDFQENRSVKSGFGEEGDEDSDEDEDFGNTLNKNKTENDNEAMEDESSIFRLT